MDLTVHTVLASVYPAHSSKPHIHGEQGGFSPKTMAALNQTVGSEFTENLDGTIRCAKIAARWISLGEPVREAPGYLVPAATFETPPFKTERK